MERGRAARAMAKVMRVADDEEGEDGKVMAMTTRMVGEWTVMARKRAMTTAMRVVGEWQQRRQRGQWGRQL